MKTKDEKKPDLKDYVIAFKKNGKVVIESVVHRVGYYDAYERALEKLRKRSS